MSTVRHHALAVLLEPDPGSKAALARALNAAGPFGETGLIDEPPGIPGRPAQPRLVGHTELKQRSMKTAEGRAALIHALAHIELNAIEIGVNECL